MFKMPTIFFLTQIYPMDKVSLYIPELFYSNLCKSISYPVSYIFGNCGHFFIHYRFDVTPLKKIQWSEIWGSRWPIC